MTETNKPKPNVQLWLVALMLVAAFALGRALGSLGGPDCPEPAPVELGDAAMPAPPASAPDSGPKIGKESQQKEVAESSAEVEKPAEWERTVLDAAMIGDWEGPEHKPLPEVKIGRPHPNRKFKGARPDFNIKFRIPVKGSGVYEGGCDTYVSGLAFCRVHDPSDKKTLRTGVRREGLVVVEAKGDSLRINIPNGVVAELVKSLRKPNRGR